jgi:outer membrane immunogenic protein
MRNLTSIPRIPRESETRSLRAPSLLRSAAVRAAAVLVALLAACDLAQAADLSAPPVAPVPYTWTGLYIGGNVGYAGTTVDQAVSGGGTGSTEIPGFLAGGQIGGNYQIGAIVLGAEADFDGSTLTKTTTAGIVSGTEQIPWVGTFRGRVGLAFGRFLAYGTAGGGATEIRSVLNGGVNGSANTTITSGAWTAGGGLEVAISDSLSARVEYLYLDTGTVNLAYIGPLAVTGRVEQNIVRAGLNYRLPVAW